VPEYSLTIVVVLSIVAFVGGYALGRLHESEAWERMNGRK
jgi:hypothetical protein